MEIVSRSRTVVSPWVTLLAKSVIERRSSAQTSVYHCLETHDYVSILTILRNGLIPIVTQFRPALEKYVLEFPGGLVDPGENPQDAGQRELAEECGYGGGTWLTLGTLDPDHGRLSNKLHAFLCLAPEKQTDWMPEPSLNVRLVSVNELLEMVRSEQFTHSQHVAMICLAMVKGVLTGSPPD